MDLFDHAAERPRDEIVMSRRDHPETSREAAADVFRKLGAKHARVLEAFENTGPEGMTDMALDARYAGQSPTLRPRRVELTRKGLIVDSGRCAESPGGRRAIVWVLSRFA
jgi:hypothetical protein